MKMCSSRHNLLLFLPTEWPEIRAPLLVPSKMDQSTAKGKDAAALLCLFLAPGTEKMLVDSQENVFLTHPIS